MRNYDQDKIRDLAFQLWDRAGQPDGREQEFWFEAERQLAEQDDMDLSEEAVDIDEPTLVPGRLS